MKATGTYLTGMFSGQKELLLLVPLLSSPQWAELLGSSAEQSDILLLHSQGRGSREDNAESFRDELLLSVGMQHWGFGDFIILGLAYGFQKSMKRHLILWAALPYLCCVHNVPQKYRVDKIFASVYHAAGVVGDVLVLAFLKGFWENCRLKKWTDEVIQKMEKVPYRLYSLLLGKRGVRNDLIRVMKIFMGKMHY